MTQPDPNAQGGTGGAQSGDPGTGAGTGTEPGTGAGDPTQSGGAPAAGDPNAGTAAETVSKAEYDRRMAQLQAADQRRQAAENELKTLKDKDIPAMEKLQRDNVELIARAEKAEADLAAVRVDNAFFKDNKYKWNNPATALRVLDRSKVEIDDKGEVHGLTAALDALAKSDPYLLAPKTEPEPEPKGSTGMPAGGGKPADTKGELKGLASRIPAMRAKGIG